MGVENRTFYRDEMKLILLIALLLLGFAAAGSSKASCMRQRTSLRRRLLKLHKRAARCGDEDSACIERVFRKIARVRKAMATLRHCKGGSPAISRKDCTKSFDEYMAARRARINRIAQKCGDEDDACVSTSMELLIALNKDHRRQRSLWRRSCGRSAGSSSSSHVSAEAIRREKKRQNYDVPEEHWVPMKVWTHEFVCSRIRSGFNRWLKSQANRREMFHKESGKCQHSDLACLRMNFQSIIHIQRKIHRARSLFASRMATCDRCSSVKVKWSRWFHRMRKRRSRLQLEACKCHENDAACMQEKVDEIKTIQKRMRERRKKAFQLHGECLINSPDVTHKKTTLYK